MASIVGMLVIEAYFSAAVLGLSGGHWPDRQDLYVGSLLHSFGRILNVRREREKDLQR